MGWNVLMSVVVLALLGISSILYGSLRWQRETRKAQVAMTAGRISLAEKSYDSGELKELPAPVERYFRRVFTAKCPMVAAVQIHHRGTLNMSESGEAWKSFSSIQYVVTSPPGFLWNARIRVMPGLSVFVRDAYMAANGVLTAKFGGVLTLVKERQTPELAHGQLMRYLAEAVWYPTALLPQQGLQWHPVDATHARATLTDGKRSVDLTFAFGHEGWICSVYAETRYRRVNGRFEATAWQGRFWNYEMRDGMWIPMSAEVAWVLPEGPKPYWRAHIEQIEYQHAL